MRQWLMERVRQAVGALRFWVWTLDARRAQSTVEYALVGALVVIAAATALTVMGEQVTSVFTGISKTLSGAAPR
jgi:Flp pilus assembly pilin Flp